MEIKVISFDIFQTLADVNKRTVQIWKGILGKNYTRELELSGARAVLSAYPASLKKALASDRFLTMEEVYLDCARAAVSAMEWDLSPDDIADNLIKQHSKAPVYEDVLPCMKKLKGKYKIVLSSDSNHMMVDGLIANFDYEELFISDDLGSYKASPDGRFFGQVVDRLGVKPQEILHIGDSISDIRGAYRAGIVSCLINRDKSDWKYDIRPDYIIGSLSEIEKILCG